jgi:hypothetical protein
VNSTYRENLLSLNRFVMVKASLCMCVLHVAVAVGWCFAVSAALYGAVFGIISCCFLWGIVCTRPLNKASRQFLNDSMVR